MVTVTRLKLLPLIGSRASGKRTVELKISFLTFFSPSQPPAQNHRTSAVQPNLDTRSLYHAVSTLRHRERHHHPHCRSKNQRTYLGREELGLDTLCGTSCRCLISGHHMCRAWARRRCWMGKHLDPRGSICVRAVTALLTVFIAPTHI